MLGLLLALVALQAQQTDRFVGHWTGAIRLPAQELAFDIDIAHGPSGYSGDISIPAQNARDLPLSGLRIAGDSIRFAIPGAPGDPTMAGVIARDSAVITGTFTQHARNFPFWMRAGASPSDAARQALRGFEAFVDSAMASWKVVGLSLGIVADGQVVYARGHGYRDRDQRTPVSTATLFAIGSSTKAFTAFGLGLLVDQGRLEWDKPVRTYLPEFRLQDPSMSERISVRDLVTHRSGLPRHDLVWYNNTTSTRDEVVRRLAHLPASRDLRELFQYNNLMFLTAGYLTGRTMSTSWEEATRTLVFEPLGMRSSNFSVVESAKTGDFSRGYAVRRDTITPLPFRNIDLIGPAGSINSNVDDMLKWVGLNLSGGMAGGRRVIGAATLRDMWAPHMPIGGMPQDRELGGTNYGLGWFLQTYRGKYLVQHGGNIDGFSALVGFFPHERIGFVILTNQNGSQLPMLLLRHASDRIFGLPPRNWNGEALAARARADSSNREAEQRKASVRVAGTSPSHPLGAYPGDYTHPGFGTIAIGLSGERLTAMFNRIPVTFEHWHYDVFNGLRNPDDPTFADLKFNFRTNLKGDIDAVAVPIEPTVEPLVFVREPDRELKDPAYLERLSGRYRLPTDSVRVLLQGTTLVAIIGSQPPYTLLPDRRNEFNVKGLQGYSLQFVMDASGKVTEAHFKQPAGVFIARRLDP
ncbi:MAG: serine hydrolase [Gemmatimonadales bacterium]